MCLDQVRSLTIRIPKSFSAGVDVFAFDAVRINNWSITSGDAKAFYGLSR